MEERRRGAKGREERKRGREEWKGNRLFYYFYFVICQKNKMGERIICQKNEERGMAKGILLFVKRIKNEGRPIRRNMEDEATRGNEPKGGKAMS